MIDNVLYNVEPNKTLRVIPQVHHRDVLFKDTYSDVLAI